jgi:endonuclease/exonuclease/phosphatase (EEP) superfamily protein YafD
MSEAIEAQKTPTAPETPPAAPEVPAQPAAAGIRRIPKRFRILTILLLAVTVFSALGTFHWVLELFSHFKPYYAVVCLLCALALLLLQAWRWMALALVLALWNGYPVAQVLLQAKAPAVKTARQLTVFHFNVGRLHEQPSRVTSYLQRHAKAIDIAVLLEATTDFDTALDEIKELYPHQIRHLEDTPFGIVLLSKHPFTMDMISFIPTERYPHIEASIKLPDRATTLAFYALHAPPPLSADMAAARNAKLDYIAREAAKKSAATPIVVGDFNVTPWSPYFQSFVSASKLRDARNARHFDHTWPVTFDHAYVGLATDHSFAHPSLPLIKRVIGPDLGSDHMPVTVTFGY